MIIKVKGNILLFIIELKNDFFISNSILIYKQNKDHIILLAI